MYQFDEATNLRRKSVRGGLWAMLGALGSAVAGFASFLILSRMLGPSAYGLMAMVDTSLALGQKLMSSGLSESLIQLPQARREHCDTLFWTLQGFGAVLVAVMVGLSVPIGKFFLNDSLPPLVAAMSLTLYLDACGLVPGALLSRAFRFSDIAQADTLSEAAGGLAGIAWALTGHGVWSLEIGRAHV